jgi:tRNA U55 pseudouridine synthase TruB
LSAPAPTYAAFDAQKAGHGGALDPLATGVLPIAFGTAWLSVANWIFRVFSS